MARNTAQVRGDEYQKRFARLLDAASQRHSRWNVFADFVQSSAIAISNKVDRAHEEEREKEYERITKDYNRQELDCFQGMFAEIMEGLEANPNQDFMGSLFMNLDLGDQYKGQFFTPYNVSLMMARTGVDMDKLKAEIDKKGWIAVSDPTCGAGGMLSAFAHACTEAEINYQERVLFVAQDIDYTAACMCYVQLSLLGCPGYVVIGDTLTSPATALDRRYLIPTPTQNVWYTPLYFFPAWHYRRQVAHMDIALNAVKSKARGAEKAISKPSANETQTERQLSFF